MERARIGVTGLIGGKVTHVRAYGGVAIHGPLDEAIRRLPHATFEDATDTIGLLRYVKSSEEISCLRRATAIAEVGIDEMIENARPGVDEAVLYARVTRAMLELGSENYHWALKTGPLDGAGDRFTEPPIGRRLQPNSLITNEVTAIWGGMVAQEVQPIILGPIPDEWKRLADIQREFFEEGLRRMKPGTPFGDLIDFGAKFGESRGVQTIFSMHGRGTGNDGPLLTSRAKGEKVRSLLVEKGNAWVFKPSVISLDGRLDFQWGGDVVVTEKGGESLFDRAPGFVSITG
jgi:Xaa-Pro aminopeptidase